MTINKKFVYDDLSMLSNVVYQDTPEGAELKSELEDDETLET